MLKLIFVVVPRDGNVRIDPEWFFHPLGTGGEKEDVIKKKGFCTKYQGN